MPAVTETLDTVQSVTQSGYKWGFETDIEMDLAPKGLNEDIIRLISARKEEPDWLLEWRLKAYRRLADRWTSRTGRACDHPPIDYQDMHYYAAPKKKAGPEEPGRGRSRTAADLREARHPAEGARDPGRRRGRIRRGRRQVAVDAVFDSVSVATTFRDDAGEGRRDLLPDLRGGARPSRIWCASISAASCRPATTSSPR